ncbi:MAG: cytochrome c [Gammaproteobacteria bacterium]
MAVPRSQSARFIASIVATTIMLFSLPGQAQQERGEALFLANCAECHQSNGRGIANVYPALDGSEVVRGSGADVAFVLIIGRGEMPSFKGALDETEMAALINYVRNAWSNSGEPISASEVAALLEP